MIKREELLLLYAHLKRELLYIENVCNMCRSCIRTRTSEDRFTIIVHAKHVYTFYVKVLCGSRRRFIQGERVLDVGNINGGDYKHGTADARTANPSCASDFTGASHTKHCTTRKETQTQTRRRRDEHPFAITIVKRHPIKQLLILVIIIL